MLVTARLQLRPWAAADAGAMAEINRDPEVTRFLNRPVDAAAVDEFSDLVSAHWSRHGFGFSSVRRRPSPASEVPGGLLGFVGVAYPSFLPALASRPELGWRLRRDTWGHGLATEAALAVKDDAFSRLGLPELIAIIHPDNVRSQRVAEKLGMAIEQQVRNPLLDIDVDVWQLGAGG